MSHQKILYIEDDVTLASVTMRALAKRGFSVTHLSCLREVRQHGDFTGFPYALLDLNLEDGSSLSVISTLVEANHKMRILVLTGYASIATAVQAIKLGATNYLAKPATMDQVLQALDAVGAEAPTAVDVDGDASMSLRRLEWEHIQKALADNDGNISATARQLKMHRRTLQRKLSKKPVRE